MIIEAQCKIPDNSWPKQKYHIFGKKKSGVLFTGLGSVMEKFR